ncbi:MAG: fibronectin type III domain-containing protein [Ilumatobacteraceae bacterium]
MRVTWGAPADFGGGTFTRYELRIAPDGEAMPTEATATVTSSTTGSFTFTGLDNGVAYNVEIVTITTANQTSIEGNTATLSSVPVSTPAQPEALTVNEFSPRVVRITWSEPLRDGGSPVTGYTVTITDSDGTSVECGTITIEDGTRSADCTSDLLELSTSYSVTVAAVNRIGAGAVASATHTTPTFTAPSTPPTITTDDDDDTDCPCIYDPDGNPVPVDVERSEPGVTPGSVTIGDGSSTVTIGGNSNDGDGQFWVDADGQLTVLPPAGVPFQGSGGLPGTTVTVFIDGVAVGTATVDDDGNWQVIIDLPTGTTGPIDATIVWVDTDGDQQTLNVPIGIYTPVTTPPDITTDDTDNCPCVFDADGNPVPVSTVTTPTGATPGRLTLGDGISTINLGTTTSGSGQATTWVGPDGNLVAQTPGTIPFTGTGALPGTTITVFIDGISVGTATVDEDGNWALNLDIPDGTNGPITITIIWTDETGQHRTLTTPITIIATGDAATAPRAPTTGTQLAPDPDTAIAIGPNGELLDSTRTTNTDTNTVTITVGDTTLNITPAENGRLDATGRLVITHPARVRVTATGMLPDTTATIWVMSDPQRLGTTTIAADGTIDTTYAIPTGIDPGNHTIQIDTVNTTGEPISIALGLTITSGLLPTTGTNTNTHLAWLTLIIAIGALTTLTTTGNRRKQRPA